MKNTIRILIVSSALILGILSSIAQDFRYGLEFSSFEVVQENRTSLNLSPSNNFSFSNGFSLSFDLFFQSVLEYNFGYVFRIIGQNNQHLDFLATPEKLTVVNSEDRVLAECMISETSKNYTSFFTFQLDLDIENDLLKITIGENVFSLENSFSKDFRKAGIVFGKCDHPQLQTSDVPKMIIKDIRISNTKGETIYYWKLSKHIDGGVYDENKNHFAKVENPKWLFDDHAFWNKRTSFTTLKNPQITYNSNENVIAVADRRNFYVYNPSSNRLVQNAYSSGFVHSSGPNQIIYNPLDSTYYSYCFYGTEPVDAVAEYDFSNKSWDNNNTREFGSEYWHHNRFLSTKEGCLYLFGGYGQHKYKNLINKYSFKTRKWEKPQYKNEQIQPRYLSGLGVIDENRLLLFGGYGSNTGLQLLSPRNYYDLYQINLPDLSVKKIWEMEPPKEQFVVANSLIVDTLNNCFYALCFPQNQYETSLYFVKFSLQKPEYEIVSNKIPFYFNDILSYADLFQNKETNELYAITFSSLSADSLATVSVYSLSYPPLLSEQSVYQPINDKQSISFIIIVIILLFLFFAIFIYRFLRKKTVKTVTDIEIETEIMDNHFSDYTEEELKIIKPVRDLNKKQAIFLFGGFQINDKKGNDISHEFSPMLKQLLLILLLNTLTEDGKGVSSTKLTDILWPNKTRESARNNRSVMISKIRQLFEDMGYLNIESSNSYWTIKLGDDIYCDYREALSLIHYMEKKSNRTKEGVIKLLNIVSFGELLPNLQTEWLDSFKANFANKLIDLLINISTQQELSFSTIELVQLADTVLIYDVLNDDALKLKCRSLVKMGKNGLAKATYNSFVKQYFTLFGTQYNYSFAQIIQKC